MAKRTRERSRLDRRETYKNAKLFDAASRRLKRWNEVFLKKKKKKSSSDQIHLRLARAAFLTCLQDDFHWDRMREIFMSLERNKIHFIRSVARPNFLPLPLFLSFFPSFRPLFSSLLYFSKTSREIKYMCCYLTWRRAVLRRWACQCPFKRGRVL